MYANSRGRIQVGLFAGPAGAEEVVEEGSEGDGEPVGGDVFEGKDAAQEQTSGEGEAEGVGEGCVPEAGELKQCGDGCGDDCEGAGVAVGDKGGDEPVESDGPEDGAAVFEEEGRETERGHAPGQADRDGDEAKEDADGDAALGGGHGAESTSEEGLARSQARQRYQLATERQGVHFLARRSMSAGLARRSGVSLVVGLRFWKVRAKPLRMP